MKRMKVLAALAKARSEREGQQGAVYGGQEQQAAPSSPDEPSSTCSPVIMGTPEPAPLGGATGSSGWRSKRARVLAALRADREETGGQSRSALHQQHRDRRALVYGSDELLFHQQSEYQDIKIVRSRSLGNTLLLNNMRALSENDLVPYTDVLMQKGQLDYYNKKILILGGGDGALLHELLKQNPRYVTVAEIDRVVIEACRDHMRPFGETLCSLIGPNYQVHAEDCMELMQRFYDENRTFDYIFNDLTEILVSKRRESRSATKPNLAQRDNLWSHIEAIFYLALDCLERDGRYVTHTTGRTNASAIEAYEKFLSRSRQPVKFERRESYMPSFMETWLFYTISKDFKHFTRPSHYALASRDYRQTARYLNYPYSL